jgi:hypothetical protein
MRRRKTCQKEFCAINFLQFFTVKAHSFSWLIYSYYHLIFYNLRELRVEPSTISTNGALRNHTRSDGFHKPFSRFNERIYLFAVKMREYFVARGVEAISSYSCSYLSRYLFL